MSNSSQSPVDKKLSWKQTLDSSQLPPETVGFVNEFCSSFAGGAEEGMNSLLSTYIRLVDTECSNPKQFPCYHQAERAPFDFYQLGIDLVRPIVDWNHSHVLGLEQLKSIDRLTQAGENVILLANHQCEIDPQIISLLIEKTAPKIAENMIFVAGHRVITDPLCMPLSRGRNLLCIFSKRYIEHSPEVRAERQQHNSKTIAELEALLNKGGACVFVAPSGGRDRKDAEGAIEIAPFDSSSAELFMLLAQKAAKKTHIVPLSLYTYYLLPPPEGIQVALGESRKARFAPAGLYFGDTINPSTLSSNEDRREARKERTNQIYQIVVANYKKIVELCGEPE